MSTFTFIETGSTSDITVEDVLCSFNSSKQSN